MDRFEQYRVFVQVAEMGSFIKAANALGLARASVSAAVRQLEMQVGVRLLYRTTRQVRLTADGAQLLERVRPLLAAADGIDQLFRGERRQLTGRLAVEVPSRGARRLIVPALPGFLNQHRDLQLVLRASDSLVDLVREGVDGAVRFGELLDSSLVVSPLGRAELVNCASPAYLAAHGEPEHIEDLLVGHMAIAYASPRTGRPLAWEYQDTRGECLSLVVPHQVTVDSVESYIAGCLAGLGLIQVPRFDVQHLLDAGRLAEVLPNRRPAPIPVSFVTPHRRQRSQRVVAFLDWFRELMRPYLTD